MLFGKRRAFDFGGPRISVGQPQCLGGKARGGEERREGADRDEVGVGEIDLVQHPVDEGEPQGHHDVQAAQVHAIQRLLNDERREVTQMNRRPREGGDPVKPFKSSFLIF